MPFLTFLSTRAPNNPNSLNGADNTVPTILPNIPNDVFKSFFNGSTTYLVNDSPNGLITLSLNTLITLSFNLFHPALIILLTPSTASITIFFIGSNALKNGSAIFSWKKSDILSPHSFTVIFNESKISISNHVLNLSISPPERFPSNPSSPNNQVWNLFELAIIPAPTPSIAPPIGPPGRKNDGNNPIAPARPPTVPRNAACLTSTFNSLFIQFLALSNALPIAPFFNFFSPFSKSSPYKNLWNISDFANNPAPIPNIAPVKGPPGKKNAGNKPNPAPNKPPILIVFLLS